MEKNQEFTVVIEDMSEDGAGVGKLDGYIWFIKDTVIGDVVRAKAMKMKKSYGFARLMEVLEPSGSRVEAACPVARRCGGCQLQSMSYEEQLQFKERKVLNNLMRIGRFGREEINMLPIMGMEHPWRYRNKAQFPFGRDKNGKIIAGFYAGRTHDIIENDDCLLGVEENQEILGIIKRFMEEQGVEPYDETGHKGLVRHALIRKGFKTGEIMVCLVINGKSLPKEGHLVKRLLEVEPGIASVILNTNTKNTNVILGKECRTLYGKDHITDLLCDVKVDISPLAFYQVNRSSAENLYRKAAEFAALTGEETLVDLYCGAGTIGLSMAGQVKELIGVEIIPEAMENARSNARKNGVKNARFLCADASQAATALADEGIRPDVVVVDPPRKGCDLPVLEAIARMAPSRVVYISCNSATAARDCAEFAKLGYRAVKAQAVDLFPRTCHVETVVLLSRE